MDISLVCIAQYYTIPEGYLQNYYYRNTVHVFKTLPLLMLYGIVLEVSFGGGIYLTGIV